MACPVVTHGEDGYPLPDTSDVVLQHVPVEEDDEELTGVALIPFGHPALVLQ